MSVETMKGMHGAVVVSTAFYRSEAWMLNARDPSCVEAVEMRCLRFTYGVTKSDRVRKERLSEQTGAQIGLGERSEQAYIRWYGYML